MTMTDMTQMNHEQAFRAMVIFLEGLYQRTGSDDLGGILSGLALLKDGRPADAAAWSDWQDAVTAVLRDSNVGS